MNSADGSEGGIKRCRYACTFCSEKKIKCDGCNPCSQCKKRHKECVYMTKKKTTNKTRRTDTYPILSQSGSFGADLLGVPEQSPIQAQVVAGFTPSQVFSFPQTELAVPAARLLPRAHVIPGAIRSDIATSPISFGATEKGYLQQFLQIVNSFVPLVPSSMIRDAMNPISLDALGMSMQKIDQVKQAACKAATWGAVSMGASIAHDPLAETFLRTAVGNLRECFDFPCKEAFCAYLVVAEAYCMLGDRPSFLRYVSFADLIRREITQELGIDCDVAMNHIRAQCFSATKGRKRVGKFSFPDFPQLAKYPTNLQAVSIIDFVLVNIMEMMENGTEQTNMRPAYQHFVTLLEPLKLRLECECALQSNPIALLVCMCMLGLSLAKVERLQDGVRILQSVVEVVEAAPHLVCMPLTWHAVSTIARCFAAIGQTDLADRLESLIQPNAHKWQHPDTNGNLPLSNGVMNINPSDDVKDVLIRDIIESFAKTAQLEAPAMFNTVPPCTQPKIEAGQFLEQHRHSSSSDTGTSRSNSDDQTLLSFGQPYQFRQLAADSSYVEGQSFMSMSQTSRPPSVAPVQLMRSISDQSTLSFACDGLGDLYDEIVNEPFYDIFPDSYSGPPVPSMEPFNPLNSGFSSL